MIYGKLLAAPHHDAALIPRLGQLSILTVTKTELFKNALILKTPAQLCFSVDGKHFKNRALRKQRRPDNHLTSLSEFSSSNK